MQIKDRELLKIEICISEIKNTEWRIQSERKYFKNSRSVEVKEQSGSLSDQDILNQRERCRLYIWRRLEKSQQQAEFEETWCLACKQQVRGGLLRNIQSTASRYQSTARVSKVQLE